MKSVLISLPISSIQPHPLVYPPTQHTLPSAHLHNTTTGPSGSFPQKRHTEVKIAASTVCSPATWISASDEKHTYSRQSVQTHLIRNQRGCCSTQLQQRPTSAAAPNHCSCYILKEKKNLRVFLCDIHTLSLMACIFSTFQAPQESWWTDIRRKHTTKKDKCTFIAPFGAGEGDLVKPVTTDLRWFKWFDSLKRGWGGRDQTVLSFQQICCFSCWPAADLVKAAVHSG